MTFTGENVAMVLAPMLGLASLLRLSRWPRFAVAGGTVVFFVIMTGAEPSVMRAGVMAVLSLSASALGRQRTAASILAASILILLIFDPWLVWSIGFQLSVAATAGMVALAGPISERLRFMPSPVALSLSTSLAAQLGVGPVLLYHFHELPGITIVANLAAFPAVSPALLLGLAAGALGLVWVQAGQLVALIARAPLRYLELLAEHLAKAPVAWITSSGGVPMFLLQLGLVIAFAAWLRTGWRPPRAAVLVAGVLLPVFIWSSALSAGPPSGLTVRFIDVGQGDATLITSAAGVHVLIDGGPDPDQVATVLESLGVRRLDLVVESHPHADHIAGLASVLTRFPVGLFVEPGCPDQTSLEREVEDTVSELHVPERFPRMGDELTVGDLRFDVLSPDRCWNGTNSDPNNDSLVMMVHDGEDTVLMSGEPEREAQQVMLDDHEELSAEVLKCPHHGGDTSLPAWFDAVDPQVVVIPVGLNNPYGHPSPVVLQELAATGARIFRTDQDGTVVVSFSGQGIQVRSDR